MKLSILDQAPISSNQTPREALQASMKLAQVGEELGYTRFWIAEHHDLPGLACSAPEVMLGYIGANTKRIRIGSGAVLLPHYKPYKVAEQYNMLATLFPNRIDIGIGRAPGGSAEATEALSEKFLEQVWRMPELVEELLHFLNRDFPVESRFSVLDAAPVPEHSPQPWLLGTGRKSALLAAKYGMPYTFGQFMSEQDGAEIIGEYFRAYQEENHHSQPQAIVTVNVICAETTEEAEEMALSPLIWSLQREQETEGKGVPSIGAAKQVFLTEKEKEKLVQMKRNMIIGNPQEVKNRLFELKEMYQVDELMIVTITYSPEDKMNSYKLIAEAVRN